MNNKKYKRLFILCIVLLITVPLTSFAHSGRTDSSGGHRDNKNKSGLGSYHYHHGYSAHLHPGGVCPYSGNSANTQNNNSYKQNSKPLPSIKIKNYPKTLNVGESAGFEYSVSNATDTMSVITSSNSDIVMVNKDGSLTALQEGTVEITITSSGVSKTFNITVKSIPVEEIEIVSLIDKIQLGESHQITAMVYPENATDKNVSWSSDDEKILEIDKYGNITTISAGTTFITASSTNNITSTIEMEVYEIYPETIECDDFITLIVGEKEGYEIDILPQNSNNKDFSVYCDDENILSYSEQSIQAISEGRTVLHVETWNGVKKDIPVKIDIIPIDKIEIKDLTQYIYSNVIDKSAQIKISAKITPDNATYKDIEWYSSNSNIVDVRNNEFIICGTGQVTLTCAAHGNIENSIDITIIDKDFLVITSIIIISGVSSIIIFKVKRRKASSEILAKDNMDPDMAKTKTQGN